MTIIDHRGEDHAHNIYIPHDATPSGDPHFGVACHFAAAKRPKPEPVKGDSVMVPALAGGVRPVHKLIDAGDPALCLRCHHSGNHVGASAMVLPGKSVLCLPCHDAGLSVFNDEYTAIALAIFFVGILTALGFWLGGTKGGGLSTGLPMGHHGVKTSCRWGTALKALLLDGLLERRLWRVSPGRWLIHFLIFAPFVLRFAWALAVLILSRLQPGAWINPGHAQQERASHGAVLRPDRRHSVAGSLLRPSPPPAQWPR
ncbi:MAG: hypothetical protein KQI62_13935 [Deltaproteobacteria bacterium]|nr:hypothetical protein [Deltaproteobacteria bacterium]